MTNRLLASTALILLALPIAACGASRDVEVTGEVSAGSTASGPIAVQFFDVLDEETPERVHAITLESPRSFQEKVALEGESVLIRAINDTDGNDACTAGEPWAEVNASIEDDDTVKVALELKAQPCPAE